MAVSPFDSALLGPLFGDAEVSAYFSDAAELDAMVRVERALARAEAACGVIPATAAQAIDGGLAGTAIDPAALAAGTAAAGVPIPAVVEVLRVRLSPEVGQWLHWGATRQRAGAAPGRGDRHPARPCRRGLGDARLIRPQMVKRAVAELATTGETLAEALTRLGPVPVDLDPSQALAGVSDAIDALLRD